MTVNGQTGDVTIDGNLRVNGTVTSNPPKTFSIAHPLDREDKVLSHATLEGPECAVFYRGQGRLERGHARIELPDYFEALTRPEGRTVLLTPCSEQEEAVTTLAASGIKDGRFTVHAGDDRNPGQKFYWEVKAVLADVEPLEVEKLKGEESTKTSCA